MAGASVTDDEQGNTLDLALLAGCIEDVAVAP